MSFAIESSPYHSRHMNGIVWSDLLTLNETRQTVEIMASFYIYIYVYTHINLNKDAKIKPLGWIKNMSVHKSKRKKALAGKRPHPTPPHPPYNMSAKGLEIKRTMASLMNHWKTIIRFNQTRNPLMKCESLIIRLFDVDKLIKNNKVFS